MKKLLVCTVTVLAVATMGMALIHCGGGGDDYECTKNDDCDPGYYCDLTVHECKEETCTPACTGKCCGPDGCGGNCPDNCGAGETCNTDTCVCEGGCTPDTCADLGYECGTWDDGCGTDLDCGTCDAGETCNAQGQCEAGCTPDCTGRECGPDPVCGESCGTCDAGEVCNADGQCEAGSTHDGAGDYCNPDAGTACSEDAGAANTCLVTNDPADGDGFCSFACSGDGADDECTADFAGGCCLDIDGGGNYFCVPAEYCGGEPGDREYLEECGTEEFGNCIEELICVGFGDDWGYCLYPCDPDNPDCPGEDDECGELTSGEGACIPPGDGTQGEFCSGFANRCAVNMICIVASDTAENGYCTSFCNCDTGVGCPVGDPPSECALQLQSGECICGYQCSTANDCPNGSAGWDCIDLGGASFCLAQ